MYSKKYVVEKIESFHRFNPIHEGMEGQTCYLAYLKPGERGWFLCHTDDWANPVHKVHTSEIRNVEYSHDQIVVTTKNTKYTFVRI